MNSEKVKKIKKALEENAHYEHHDKLSYIDDYKCKLIAYADILTYINELESELEKEQINNLNCDTELQYKEKRIAELEEDKETWQRKAINYYHMAKSYGVECIIDNDIDEILKEFINE